MKNAKIVVAAVEVTCPSCREPIPGDGGSLTWDVNSVRPGQVVTCLCGESSKIPRVGGKVANV